MTIKSNIHSATCATIQICGGMELFFSYNSLVGVKGRGPDGWISKTLKYSPTTTRHIGKYFHKGVEHYDATREAQEDLQLDALKAMTIAFSTYYPTEFSQLITTLAVQKLTAA